MANTDEGAIKGVIEAYGDRLRTSDVRGAVDLFTGTAALMQPDRAAAVGSEQLSAAFRSGFEVMAIDARFDVEDILVKSDLAAVRPSSTEMVTVRATGQSMPTRFRELFVLERVDGAWKIAQYMFQQMNHT